MRFLAICLCVMLSGCGHSMLLVYKAKTDEGIPLERIGTGIKRINQNPDYILESKGNSKYTVDFGKDGNIEKLSSDNKGTSLFKETTEVIKPAVSLALMDKVNSD